MPSMRVEITPEMEAEAARNPGGWVYKVDWEYSPDQYTPPEEGLIGSWYVGSEGRLTGQFRPNPHYTGDIET